MKQIKRLTALLLALTACLWLAGCGGKDGGPSAEESSTATIDPTKDAATLYKEAVSALEAKEDVKQTVNYAVTRAVGLNSYRLEGESAAIYRGIGTDGFSAYISERSGIDLDIWRTDKFYRGGRYTYAPRDGGIYYKEMEPSEFIAMQTPVVLLDSSLYESLEFDGADRRTIVLKGASAAEAWAAPEYAELSYAEGRVLLDKSGGVEQFVYTAEYKQGAASCRVEYTSAVADPKNSDRVPPPGGAGDSFDEIEMLELMKLSFSATKSLYSFEHSVTKSLYSQACGMSADIIEQFYAYGSNAGDFICKADMNATQYDSDGNTTDISAVQTYKDGTITIVSNAGEITESRTVEELRGEVFLDFDEAKPSIGCFETFTVDDLSDCWRISYTLNGDENGRLEDVVSKFFFGGEDKVDELASTYSPDKTEGSLCIDKNTLYITSVVLNYQGTHTINDRKYVSGYTATLSFEQGTEDTYAAITGQTTPQ